MTVQRRVIAGVSGSVRGVPALRRAAAEARLRDAVLLAVHAWGPEGWDRYGWPEPALAEACRNAAWQRAWQRLWDSFDVAFGGMPPGVNVETMVVHGPAGPVLSEVAARDDDLLVIGTGRKGVFRRLPHTRVARYCAGHVTCPVLLVPPTALAREMDRPLRTRLRIRRAIALADDP